MLLFIVTGKETEGFNWEGHLKSGWVKGGSKSHVPFVKDLYCWVKSHLSLSLYFMF